MATDVERLIVTLEASTTKYEKALERARAQTNSQLAAAEARIKKFNSVGSNIGAAISGGIKSNIAGIAASIGSALTVDKIIEYSDSWTNLENKLRAVGVESKDLAKVQQNLLDIAQRSRSDVADIGDLYSKLALTSKDLGASQADVAKVTETVAKALKLGGANAQQTSAAITQLGQALASGRLQGDELRSLLENAPLLANKLAKNLGVGVGELKQMGAEGKLLSSDVFRALLQSSEEVNQSFKNTKTTFSDYFTAFNNGVIEAINNLQKLYGISEAEAAARKKAADQFGSQSQSGYPTSLAMGGANTQQLQVQGPQFPPEYLAAQKDYIKSQEKINQITPYAVKLFQDIGNSASAAGVSYGELTSIVEQFGAGMNGNTDSAAQAAKSLEDLGNRVPALKGQIAELIRVLQVLAANFNLSASSAQTMKAAIGDIPAAPPAFRTGAADAKEVAAVNAETQKYIQSKQQLANLQRLELAAVTQTEKVKVQALKDGIVLTNQQAEQIAKLQVAQKESFKGGGGGLSEAFKTMKQDIAEMTIESNSLAQAYGMITTSGSAAEAQLKLISAAIQSGVPLTEEMKKKIENLAIAYGEAADKWNAIQAQKQQMDQLAQTISSSFEDAFMSIIDGSSSAADAFKNMAKQIIAAIIKMQLQSLFSGGSTSGGASGGIFGSLFKNLFGFAGGGPVSSGNPVIVGENGPEVLVPNRNSRIVPSKALKSSGSGSANVKVLNFAGAQVETKTKRTRGGQNEIEILVTEIGKRISEGNFDKQFRSRFGVGPRLVER